MKLRQVLASALLLLMCSVAALAQGQAAGGRPSDDELWQMVRDSNDAGLLEAFIAGFPESRYIPEARKRLAGVKPPPVQPPASPSRVTTVAPPSPPAAHDRPIAPSGSVAPAAMFREPRQGPQASTSMRVDWCLRWANDCGKPAADAFCRSQGFARATSFADELTGGPTWVIADRQICAIRDCRALRDVQCAGFESAPAMPAEATIEAPRVNGMALAACLHPSRGCEGEAAGAFCVAAGYAGAKAFGQGGGAAPSIHLGDRSVCSGPRCRSITHVVCSR